MKKILFWKQNQHNAKQTSIQSIAWPKIQVTKMKSWFSEMVKLILYQATHITPFLNFKQVGMKIEWQQETK